MKLETIIYGHMDVSPRRESNTSVGSVQNNQVCIPDLFPLKLVEVRIPQQLMSKEFEEELIILEGFRSQINETNMEDVDREWSAYIKKNLKRFEQMAQKINILDRRVLTAAMTTFARFKSQCVDVLLHHVDAYYLCNDLEPPFMLPKGAYFTFAIEDVFLDRKPWSTLFPPYVVGGTEVLCDTAGNQEKQYIGLRVRFGYIYNNEEYKANVEKMIQDNPILGL